MARRESFREEVIRNVSSGARNSPSFAFHALVKFGKDVWRNVDNGVERFLEKMNGQKAKPIPRRVVDNKAAEKPAARKADEFYREQELKENDRQAKEAAADRDIDWKDKFQRSNDFDDRSTPEQQANSKEYKEALEHLNRATDREFSKGVHDASQPPGR
jgi:hypothetical protein